MRTRIELGTSGSIDLLNEVPYSLNYAIADIREPDKRNASFSKTITIPGSKQNNIIFAHIFEITVDSNFNPNLKTPSVIFVDDIEVMRGYLRLLKIKVDDEKKIEYECSIIGNVGNIFTDMADSMLSDLDFSEFDHTYNKANQKASWSAAVGAGYVYPFIDYGYTNGNIMNVKNFFPALYAKQYIDKICSAYGYSYTSNFLDSTIFKSLIIPYNGIGLRLTEVQITPRLFSASIGSSGSITLPSSANLSTNPYSSFVPYNAESLDPSNQFNISTYRFTAALAGDYNFESSFDYQLNSIAISEPFGWIVLSKYSAGVYTTISSVAFTQFGGISTTLRTAYIIGRTALAAGDEMVVGLYITASGPSTPKLNLSGGYFRNSVNNSGLFDGDLVVMSDAVPKKIKQKDFFMTIVKMFNLYIETDKNLANKLYIEPRDDFYTQGVNRDWSDKQDISKELEQVPMGELDAVKFIYTYTDDADYYNSLYKKSYLEAYGTRTVDVNNEFVKGKKETKLIFSPTPLVGDSSTDRIISKIFSTDSAGNITPKASNIRILYYGGVKTTINPWTYTSIIQGNSSETTYPYAGHLDNPQDPTIDLSFAVPFEVYYTTGVYTNNNLYNKYYRKFLQEIVDKDSKIVTGYFYLTPLDIYLLDFRDTFYVKGVPLRLNKVYDYNPVTPGLTKCEFIKIKFANAFAPQTLFSDGGNATAFTTNDLNP